MSKNNLQPFHAKMNGLGRTVLHNLLNHATKSGLFRHVEIIPKDSMWLYVGSRYDPTCDCYDFVCSDNVDYFGENTVEVTSSTSYAIINHAKNGITIEIEKPETFLEKPMEVSYLEVSKKRLVEINKAIALLQEERLSVENIIELNRERDILKEGW